MALTPPKRLSTTHDAPLAPLEPIVVANSKTDLSDSLSSIATELFEKLFFSLRHLNSQNDFMIAIQSSPEDYWVKWASGVFAPVLEKSLPIKNSDGQLALWSQIQEPTCLKSSQLRLGGTAHRTPGTHALDDIPEGHLALFRLSSPDSNLSSVIIFVWQSESAGRFTREKVAAFKHILELISAASPMTYAPQAQEDFVIRESLARGKKEEYEEFYREFADVMHQCFWVLDLDAARVINISENFERVWGSSRQCLSDGLTGFMHTVHPTDRDRVLSEFHTGLGKELDVELRVIDDIGEIRWIWMRAFPKKSEDDAGYSSHIVLIADDITEKKQQEETTRSNEVQLASNARIMAVGDLANGVAHEINNPLTIIVGKASEIRSRVEKGKATPQEVMEAAEKIQKTSIRISEIVSSLKALSRPDRKPLMHIVSMRKVFQDLRDTVAEKFKAHQVTLELPELVEDLAAEMNPTLISQMIFNLINNAFDAIQKENEKWVRIETAETPDSIFIYVTDSGPGIPIKYRSRIFDPFFTTKGPDKGTGLGLSLSAGIAARHSGSLSLDSLHPYTRFVIQLPKRQAQKQSESSGASGSGDQAA